MTVQPIEAALMELAPRYVCGDCGGTMRIAEVLVAPSPFDPSDELSACPHCKAVGNMTGACQSQGCSAPSSSGTANVMGFRYVSACWDHAPQRGLFVPDRTLIGEAAA